MRNPISQNINKIIQKVERNSLYYKNKASDATFLRDGKEYVNDEEWQAYWLAISAYWDDEIAEYYRVLQYVNKEGIGGLGYPQSPNSKKEA